jgi:hypothetical protein
MKRSEINQLMEHAEGFFAEHGFRLPAWAGWDAAQWHQVGPEAAEIARHGLGWDITDFGSGDFLHHGLLLFTIRNGRMAGPVTAKPYAEKIMIVREDQLTPMHYHEQKMEDIINRGGGRLVLELWNSTPDGWQADTPVNVSTDGLRRELPAGGKVVLDPGASITLTPRLYHAFWGEQGKGTVLVGEVSSVNDDRTDNYFIKPVGRFPEIDEDAPPRHLLCTEYPAHLRG